METGNVYCRPTNCHRFVSNCNRHPDENVTGFCASCLRERLAGLNSVTCRRSSTYSVSSSATALKSISPHTAIGINGRPFSSAQRQINHNKNTSAPALRSDLRRCKSFAGGRRTAAVFEPRRKSCDVGVRSTLWSLFYQDDRDRIVDGGERFLLSSSSAAASLFAGNENEAEANSAIFSGISRVELDGIKPMKDHIDLDSHSQTKKISHRDLKMITGSFWLAASMFSKKLHIWRRKHKPSSGITEESSCDTNKVTSPLPSEEKNTAKSNRQFRYTHSNIVFDAFGRRSCDIAPRFSLDAGRISYDEQRCSWDEPRASWDGYLISGDRSLPPRLTAKLANAEDSVRRSDGLIPVEEVSMTPGCSAQTRDYYADSSNRRRRSLDRSNSTRRHSVMLCETKPVSNANTSELFSWSNLERESKICGSNSLREDCSGNFNSACRDPTNVPAVKKPRIWSIWEFIHRRSGSRAGGPQAMDRSYSETWPEFRATGRMHRSVGARRSSYVNGRLSSTPKSGGIKKTKETSNEVVLEKNRSARYSPSHFDNGLLRFYLTPMRGSRRSGVWAKGKFKSPRSMASSIFRLY